MSWQRLATIQTTSNWILTEPITGSLFRITHSVSGTNLQSLRSVIAQAFNGNDNTYFDFKRLAYKSETEALLFIQPKEIVDRKLAIKRLDDLPNSWDITIEVFQSENDLTIEDSIINIQTNLEQIKMTLTNPITVNIPALPPPEGVTTVIKTTVPPPSVAVDAVVLAAANSNRRGLTIWNDTSGDLLLEFDGVPTFTSFGVIVRSGGYYESQYGFAGEVQGIFTDRTGQGALVREFVINAIQN